VTPIERDALRERIVFRPLDEDDLPDLSTMITGMSPEVGVSHHIRDLSAEYYHWIYFENPAGPAITVGGWHDDTLVTSFAITPKRIQFGDDVVLCGKTMDMFTEPSYQGMGLNKQVTSRVFAAAKERGIRMWYVTPSEASYPIFKSKWGYVESVPVNYVVGVLDYEQALAAGAPVLGRLGGRIIDRVRRGSGREQADVALDIRPVQAIGAEIDRLWQRCSGYGVALVRDSQYLNWRYVANPDTYHLSAAYLGEDLQGILVTKYTTRRGLKIGEVVDFVTAPAAPVVRRALLREALERFRGDGCVLAQSWAIEDSPLEADLRSVGIGHRRQKLAIVFSPEAPRPAFYDRRAWFLTAGDGNDV
jgi:GNAT superfamily N-acetyltransferase